MSDVYYVERLPRHPLLGRHVRHDPRSRQYAFPTAGLTLVSTKHTRRIPVLDQGQLGSCTGNAGIGCLGTSPYYETDPGGGGGNTYSLDEAGAVQLYSDATKADDYPGSWPPDDTGSDGLTVAKVLTKAGEISGYRHTFDLDGALLALTQFPVITGTVWYQSMFNPAADGKLTVDAASGVAGGHEYVVDELDVERQRVWMTNSWGAGWGQAGRAWLDWGDWGRLLAQQGDVTVFTPLTQPAPTPTPPAPSDIHIDQADAAMWLVGVDWTERPHTHIAHNHDMKQALKLWARRKGLV